MTDLLKVRVQLPHGSDPSRGPGWTDLWVREDTSDEAVLDEIWVHDTYHCRGMNIARAKGTRDECDPGMPIVDGRRPLVLDVGANTGLFSALVLQMFPDSRVIAIEPDADNLELLTLNTAKWRDRVQIVPAALGAERGTTSLVGSHGTGYTSSAGEGPRVEVLPLAEFLNEPVALLKVDCESAEFDIFAACPSEALARVDHIHMEIHGTREAPWIDDAPRRYGELMTKLAYTHSVQVFGRPDEGAMAYCHRYDL